MTLQRHNEKPVRVVPMGTMLSLKGPNNEGSGWRLQPLLCSLRLWEREHRHNKSSAGMQLKRWEVCSRSYKDRGGLVTLPAEKIPSGGNKGRGGAHRKE